MSPYKDFGLHTVNGFLPRKSASRFTIILVPVGIAETIGCNCWDNTVSFWILITMSEAVMPLRAITEQAIPLTKVRKPNKDEERIIMR
jgi:hypothetical protein